MIKIDIVSGFLGAGKTTLIKKLFESSFKNEKVVLIENEFGEIGIDGSFLKESGVEIKEINSGCICCSLVGDFATSLKEVINKYAPERIIIEPSGVGKLTDIVDAINKVDADLKLNILATVVDGVKAKMYMKNFGEFFNNQVEAANTIVIAKTDKMTEEKLIDTVNLIKEKNKNANLITTAIKELDGEQLLKTLEEKISLKEELMEEVLKHHHHEECDDEHCECHHHHHEECEDEHCECHHHHHEECEDEHCECHHHHHEECEDEHCECHHHHHEECEDEHCECHHHHHADDVFTSWGEETPISFSKEQLINFLEELKNNESLGVILRSKGILKASDQTNWYYFDFVAGDYEIREGRPDVIGKIVVIGSKIKEEEIKKIFYKKA